MKRKYLKLLALLLTGCIVFGGCGAEDAQDGAAENKEEQQENQDGEDEEIPPAPQNAGSSTSNTTFPSASTEPLIPSPFSIMENEPEPSVVDTETHTVVGIITDATHYSVSIQVPDGSRYDMTIPESGVTGNLNSITIGQLATFTYIGSLDESHASLTGISSSSMITGIYLEEYAFAIKIINAARAMDLKALSDLTNFPVFLSANGYSGSINTSGEFEAIDNEKIFTEALVTRLANYNLFDLKYTDAGFVMGNGAPSLTFDVDDDGILGIIGINCDPPKETTDQK